MKFYEELPRKSSLNKPFSFQVEEKNIAVHNLLKHLLPCPLYNTNGSTARLSGVKIVVCASKS